MLQGYVLEISLNTAIMVIMCGWTPVRIEETQGCAAPSRAPISAALGTTSICPAIAPPADFFRRFGPTSPIRYRGAPVGLLRRQEFATGWPVVCWYGLRRVVRNCSRVEARPHGSSPLAWRSAPTRQVQQSRQLLRRQCSSYVAHANR